MSLPEQVQDIAVIGCGPCGSGLTKALVGENSFRRIKVYERRSKSGGLWNYSPLKSSKAANQNEVPSEDPHAKVDKVEALSGEKFYESPVYKYLDANVPKDLMAYKDYPFPDDVPLFPTHEQILKYIENYSKDIEKYVTFNEEVISLQYLESRKKWEVISSSTINDITRTDYFDAVAIAIGSYDKPFIPNVSGLEEWHKQYPHSIIHAKSYDEPAQFENAANILVVGNSASGADIAYQLATRLNKTIYKSVRSENNLPAGKDDRIKDVGDLLKFDPITKSVYFKDGFRLDNVDNIIFATGYLKSIPFIKNENLITDGAKVHGLYKHLIYYSNPSLAIIGLPRFVLPTRLSETQGCWLARVWSGRIKLPSYEEMKKSNESLEGEERNHHDLMFPKDVDYSNELNDQCSEAEGDYGYFAVHWDERQKQIRGAIKPIKEGYIKYMTKNGKPAASLKVLEDEKYFEYP